MLKAIALIIGGIVGVGLMVIALRSISGEDAWICSNGAWVKHGKPYLPQPAFLCPTNTPTEKPKK